MHQEGAASCRVLKWSGDRKGELEVTSCVDGLIEIVLTRVD